MLFYSDLSVFIIEDERLISRNLDIQLSLKGVEHISIFDHSESALAALEITLPSIILVDYFIKGKRNGGELAHSIRQIHPHIPIVFMTAQSDHVITKTLTHFSNSMILSKPFLFEALDSCMSSLLCCHINQPINQPAAVEKHPI